MRLWLPGIGGLRMSVFQQCSNTLVYCMCSSGVLTGHFDQTLPQDLRPLTYVTSTNQPHGLVPWAAS